MTLIHFQAIGIMLAVLYVLNSQIFSVFRSGSQTPAVVLHGQKIFAQVRIQRTETRTRFNSLHRNVPTVSITSFAVLMVYQSWVDGIFGG